MYADRVAVGSKRSVKERLNGNSGEDLGRSRQINAKRKRQNDDKWEHDLYDNDEEPQVSNRKVGARDLRLKLQKKGSQQVSQSGKGSLAGGVRDLREKLSGVVHSQEENIDLPKIKPVLEAVKSARKSVAVEAPASDTQKVSSSAPARKKTLQKAETSVDGLLLSLGLEKYKIIFQAEEIDMTALMHMTDEDLKALGIPMLDLKMSSSKVVMEKKDIAKWSTNDENIFIDIMVDHVKKGNRLTTTFTKKAWSELITEFRKRTGLNYKLVQFKNKFNKMRVQYREFKKLKEVPTGFGWDNESKTATAPKDVWEHYILTNPEAKQFQGRGCPRYPDFQIIFGDTTATGATTGANTIGGLLDSDSDAPATGMHNVPSSPVEVNVEQLGVQDEEEQLGENTTRARSRTPTSRRRGSSSTPFEDTCKVFQDFYEKRAKKHASKISNMTQCTQILSAIPDLSGEVYMRAVRELLKTPGLQDFFIAAPPERRLDFLNSL